MNKGLVSIIIPAWNSENYIKESIDSALSQTYKNIEIIVIDDGSTDNTKKVINDYIKSRKIYYIFQPNKGLAGARNTGILSAKGEYIALLDSDDLFLPKKIQKQVEALEKNPDFSVCYCDLLHFTEREPRQFFHHRYSYPSGNLFGELLKKQFINPLTVIIKKTVFDTYGIFDENLKRSEDWELWLRFAHAGIKFLHLKEILAYYRIRNAGNLSSIESEPQMKEKNLEIFLNLKKKMSSEELIKYNFYTTLNNLRKKLSLSYLMIGEKKKALEKYPSFILKLIITIFPDNFLRLTLIVIRKLKHRSLLKKYSQTSK